ncbi:hypothetical protein BDZ91DRAFT_750684 [Kalaharituber pfeilii]|nr:hypothetical protein BDZ91DRAFT_750684 [Kalaharituber pfeilii]
MSCQHSFARVTCHCLCLNLHAIKTWMSFIYSSTFSSLPTIRYAINRRFSLRCIFSSVAVLNLTI